MGIDVSAYLSILLYRHNAVIVPGFGGFIATPVGATIDHASGMMYPPSKIVSFNEHLVINDGYLINYIRQRHGITVPEARIVIDNFVQSVRDILRNNETVMLPEVGKLSQSSITNKIIFTADKTNFNTAAYGLPPLHYYPTAKASASNESIAQPQPSVAIPVAPSVAEIAKEITQPTVKATEPTPAADPNQAIAVSDNALHIDEPLPMRQTWYERIGLRQETVPAMIIAGALTIAAGMYWMSSRTKQKPDAQPVAVSEETRVNVKPKAEDTKSIAETTTAPIEEKTTPSKAEKIETPNVETPSVAENEANRKTTKTPVTHKSETNASVESTKGTKKCTVVVGGFIDDTNISKLSKRIKNKGFTPFKRAKNNMTLVGATFSFADNSDKTKQISQIKRWFGKDAYVLKK